VTKRQLWVEGYSDKRFLQGLQRHTDLTPYFEVKFPGEKPARSGKASATKNFKTLLSEAAEPGRYEALGLCVDADSPPDGGFSKTDAGLAQLLAESEFRKVDADRRVYRHQRSGCLASYWISPTHALDGYLESAALASLAHVEKLLLNSVVRAFIDGLAAPRFVERNKDRALTYVYLGLQEKPDKSLATLLDDGLMDIAIPPLADLVKWLRDLYT
jgi:hypothetical protein